MISLNVPVTSAMARIVIQTALVDIEKNSGNINSGLGDVETVFRTKRASIRQPTISIHAVKQTECGQSGLGDIFGAKEVVPEEANMIGHLANVGLGRAEWSEVIEGLGRCPELGHVLGFRAGRTGTSAIALIAEHKSNVRGELHDAKLESLPRNPLLAEWVILASSVKEGERHQKRRWQSGLACDFVEAVAVLSASLHELRRVVGMRCVTANLRTPGTVCALRVVVFFFFVFVIAVHVCFWKHDFKAVTNGNLFDAVSCG